MESLASYRKCGVRIREGWAAFRDRRAERLVQEERHGHAAEKVAENIAEDLFTEVLDWKVSDLNNQVGFADLVLTSLGIKHLVVEVKRPNTLSRRAAALEQARRYASEQRILRVAVTDGVLFYAADVDDGGLRTRALLSLGADEPPVDELFWLSVDGIWRRRPDEVPGASFEPAPVVLNLQASAEPARLSHPKYRLPCHCFAFVGDASDCSTWKLPYLDADGRVDEKRLGGAVRAIIANYRGAKVSIPESAVPATLARLGKAAASVGRIGPAAPSNVAATYARLAEVLLQLGLLEQVLSSAAPRPEDA